MAVDRPVAGGWYRSGVGLTHAPAVASTGPGIQPPRQPPVVPSPRRSALAPYPVLLASGLDDLSFVFQLIDQIIYAFDGYPARTGRGLTHFHHLEPQAVP